MFEAASDGADNTAERLTKATMEVVAMAATDDTTKALPGKPEHVLGQLIEAQRTKLLQAHAIMICLREVLLYAEGDEAVTYAEAANVAAVLANDVAEGLDSVRLKPVFDALRLERAYRPAAEQGLSSGMDDRSSVKGPSPPPYVC